ncbi:YbhB/YbcL family Raf kinase inhibitor-like protein [Candidatus Peregrinibacteria bacterium]|nr:YbhB/YbcL family Raf kinase inhibitor-like protein [Candidatus Peregrinibacteria bacterium]
MVNPDYREAPVTSEGKEEPKNNENNEQEPLIIKSGAFRAGAEIPAKYTCDAGDVSPEISWENVPEGTKTLALIVDDPDAPDGTWVHWVVWNIPVTARNLSEGISESALASLGAILGKNDFDQLKYGGPCPPSGTHRYFFKLSALNTELNLVEGSTKAELLNGINGHVLGEAELVANYSTK